MTSFVVDASVAIKGFIGEEHSDVAARVLAQPLAAPDLLCAECANILWKKVARDELTFDEVETIISALSKWGIVLYSMHGFWLSATRIACQLNHPSVRLLLSGAGGGARGAVRHGRRSAGPESAHQRIA